MAYEVFGFRTGTLLAAADHSANQYRCVALDAAGKIVLATVAGQKVIGVLQNAPLANQPCDIVHLGICPVKAGAAFANGAALMSGVTTGKPVTAATVGSTIIGFAVESAAAADEIVSALINCGAGVV